MANKNVTINISMDFDTSSERSDKAVIWTLQELIRHIESNGIALKYGMSNDIKDFNGKIVGSMSETEEY